MTEAVVFDLELQNNEAHPVNGPKNNSDSDDELLEIEEVRDIIMIIGVLCHDFLGIRAPLIDQHPSVYQVNSRVYCA